MEAIHAALGDIAQAGRVVGKFDLVAKHAEESAAEGTPETEVAVEASELGEPPARSQALNVTHNNKRGDLLLRFPSFF